MCSSTTADEFGNYCAFSYKKWVKARKNHICNECGRVIQAGKRYARAAGKYDGNFWHSKYCRPCGLMTEWLLARGHGWLGGHIKADVIYCIREDIENKHGIRRQ